MFAIGHFSVAYLVAKASASKLKTPLNMPLLLTASIIPDIDLILYSLGLDHRGPTHSLITIIAFTIPLLILYKKTFIPYFAAITSHTLIGDYFTGGTQLLWPITNQTYTALHFKVNTPTYALLELIPFTISIAIMVKKGDLQKIITDKHKIALIMPIGATVGPVLVASQNFNLQLNNVLPVSLILPSLFYLTIFSYSIIAPKLKKADNNPMEYYQDRAIVIDTNRKRDFT
ncbi:MAG TPA: metal-dependent hydrolase [Candidatus Sulfotelmatobacter sp.]|nr:metal-dependent hydrolase [Candidatus Sulfotelmatobacter sp.]